MTTPISREAVLEILRTPAASDTFPDMIRRVEALEGGGSSPPFHFDRYINGVLMAEGVTIERQSNMSSAMQEAARIASRGPSGEAPVLVYFGAALEPVAQPETPTPGQLDPEQLARRFHDIYEQLAPNFGYETRPETRNFDPESPNGKLMIAVCGALQPTPGQFTTMCLAIEDVITGRGFDVDPWRSIQDNPPPDDGEPHIRGLWVTSNRTGAKWWEAVAGHVDDDGDFVDHDGNAPWRCEDYGYWMPLPKPPGETTSAIPEAVKAYLRNALMVGGWRGERD